MPRKPVERKPMKERIGWAVVHRSGQIMSVGAFTRKEAIDDFVDPGDRLTTGERRGSWGEQRKAGYSIRKVRISAV